MIKIPTKLWNPSNINGRTGQVFIYTLDRNTIGVTSEYEDDWATISLYTKTWDVLKYRNNWQLELPRLLKTHYLIQDPETKLIVSISGQRIIIIVKREGR